MAKQGLIYDRPRPVAKSWHADWYVDDTGGYGFARELSAVPVATIEIPFAAREYPLVFIEGDDGTTPLALLGLRDHENLFVDEKGEWTGRYIPAFVRRYPFVLARDPENQTYTLCIDEASERCNTDGRGQALFDDSGEPSEYLQRMLNLSQDWERATLATHAFCAKLKELDLLVPRRITFRGPRGSAALAGGFSAVDPDRLRGLSDEVAGELLRAGRLELVAAHLISLNGIEALAGRLSAKVPEEAGPEPKKPATTKPAATKSGAAKSGAKKSPTTKPRRRSSPAKK